MCRPSRCPFAAARVRTDMVNDRPSGPSCSHRPGSGAFCQAVLRRGGGSGRSGRATRAGPAAGELGRCCASRGCSASDRPAAVIAPPLTRAGSRRPGACQGTNIARGAALALRTPGCSSSNAAPSRHHRRPHPGSAQRGTCRYLHGLQRAQARRPYLDDLVHVLPTRLTAPMTPMPNSVIPRTRCASRSAAAPVWPGCVPLERRQARPRRRGSSHWLPRFSMTIGGMPGKDSISLAPGGLRGRS
jgi:hypothetical protein